LERYGVRIGSRALTISLVAVQNFNSMPAPAFAKNPKVILGTIVVAWAAYVVYTNFKLDPVQIHLLPFAATLQFKVSAIVIGSALFGVVATLAVQFLWRRQSKPTSVIVTTAGSSNKTVA
jgi:hypothetical protein